MNGTAFLPTVLSVLFGALLLVACGDSPAGEPGAAEGDASRRDEASERADAPLRDDAWVRVRHHVSLLLAGNQRGKMKPCGCSEPQLGGLERLATLTELARRRAGDGFAAVSLGWTMGDKGEAQEETKASLYRAAMELLGFDAMLLGTTDLHVPALAQPFLDGRAYDLPAPPANVPLSEDGPMRVAAGTEPFATFEVKDLEVRALSIVNPEALHRLGDVAQTVLPPAGALQLIQPRPDTLWIVSTDVSGASMEGLIEAVARLGPAVIVDLGGSVGADRVESVPLVEPVVVSLADLGKEAGVLDLDPAPEGEGWLVSYHAVPLDPDMETLPSERRGHVSSLFDVYRARVRERGYLTAFEALPNADAVAYVGSARCAKCHPGIYESWLATAHAEALRTLERRDYHWDPECVRCHVVGFERFPDGRWGRILGGFRNPSKTPHLGGVGCECCHGPGEAHVESPTDRSLWASGGPNVRHPGKQGCAVCHDVENSFGFQERYESDFLPKVDHREVPSDRRIVYAR